MTTSPQIYQPDLLDIFHPTPTVGTTTLPEPNTPTGDLPTLVIDGIRNLTTIIP